MSNDNIPSEFIYGYYKRNKEDDTYDLVINPNHVSKKDGYVSQEMMDLAKKKLEDIHPKLLEMLQVDLSEITNEKIDQYIEYIRNNPLLAMLMKDEVDCTIETLNELRRYVRDEKEDSLEDLLARLDKIKEEEKKRTM